MASVTWITAIATVVNAIAVVVLVLITRVYAKSAERQAKAAESQAHAATAQASAAQSQSNIASATLHAMREQYEERTLSTKIVVQHSITSALALIELWEHPVGRSLESLIKSKSLPLSIRLVPYDYIQAMDSAYKVSRDFASELGSCFNCLENVAQQLEILRTVDWSGYGPIDMARIISDIQGMLADSKRNLQRLQLEAGYAIFKPPEINRKTV